MTTKTITKQRRINATPDRVFQALTDKAELERWFVYEADVDLRPGGIIRTGWAPGMGEHGIVKEVTPNQVFSFTWEGDFSPSPTVLTFGLAKEQDATLVTLTHSGIGSGPGWEAYAGMDAEGKGWEAHLSDLASLIETGTCPPPGPRG